MNRYYVNLYLINQVYGGPERGWCYNYGTPVCGKKIPNELKSYFDDKGSMPFLSNEQADFYLNEINEVIMALNLSRPALDSILSEGKYSVVLEPNLPKQYKTERIEMYETN